MLAARNGPLKKLLIVSLTVKDIPLHLFHITTSSTYVTRL